MLMLGLSNLIFAQTKTENSGWFLSVNSIKLNAKWGIHTDVQWRSQPDLEGTRHILFRPGLTFHFNSKQQATLGYLLVHSETVNGGSQEHRVWQQFIQQQKIAGASLSHRFRLEQRFLDKAENNFAQRFRYFARAILPLEKQTETFNKGLFLALQNELFFNIQNQKATNGKFFDQNRALIGLGYRLSNQLDLELAYLDQRINGALNNTHVKVGQLGVYAKF